MTYGEQRRWRPRGGVARAGAEITGALAQQQHWFDALGKRANATGRYPADASVKFIDISGQSGDLEDWVEWLCAGAHRGEQMAATGKSDILQEMYASQGSDRDSELLKLAEDFLAIDRQLDDLAAEDRPKDLRFLALHKQWEQACSRVASLSASTNEGRRAKAKVLLVALEVIAPRREEREIHDELAESLARDVISLS